MSPRAIILLLFALAVASQGCAMEPADSEDDSTATSQSHSLTVETVAAPEEGQDNGNTSGNGGGQEATAQGTPSNPIEKQSTSEPGKPSPDPWSTFASSVAVDPVTKSGGVAAAK